jgi:TonB family protein
MKRLFLQVFVLVIWSPLAIAITPEEKKQFNEVYSQYQRYANEGNWKESVDYAKQAWDMSTRLLGPEHRNTAKLAHNFALNLARTGSNTGAMRLYESALESYEAAYGADSPELVPLLIDMADSVGMDFSSLGIRLMSKDAERDRDDYLSRALQIAKKSYAKTSTEYIAALTRIGDVYAQKNRSNTGVKHLKKAYSLSKKHLGIESLEFAAAALALGSYYQRDDSSARAIAYLEEAWTVYTHNPGADDPASLKTVHQLIKSHIALKDAEAVARYRLENQQLVERIGDVMEEVIVKVRPEKQPKSAWENKYEWVVVSFSINENGDVTDAFIDVSSGPEHFHQPSLDAVRQYVYSPRAVGGKALPVKNLSERFTYYK